MVVNLLDLLLLSTGAYNRWQEHVRRVAYTLHEVRMDVVPSAIPDEDARINDDGSLTIFCMINGKETSQIIPKDEWSITQFANLNPEVAFWVVQTIMRATPCDRRSCGEFWEGKILSVIDAKGYISPDGKVLRFMYNGKGPFQSLNETSVFGFSLGDAVPEWAKG